MNGTGSFNENWLMDEGETEGEDEEMNEDDKDEEDMGDGQDGSTEEAGTEEEEEDEHESGEEGGVEKEDDEDEAEEPLLQASQSQLTRLGQVAAGTLGTVQQATSLNQNTYLEDIQWIDRIEAEIKGFKSRPLDHSLKAAMNSLTERKNSTPTPTGKTQTHGCYCSPPEAQKSRT